MGTDPRVICLLPARNAASHLPGYLRSAARYCDGIVALDDGSTDQTRELLDDSPLVELLLMNRPRKTYRGWDDVGNRNRLLDAADELEPDWIISIDADERLAADDARALRGFLATDALAACAYGFLHYRMWGARSCDPTPHWIYRLFSYEYGQRFPERRLHFSPIPSSIPRERWVRTTIRVQHLAATDEPGLRDRLAKYDEADPERSFDNTFGGMLEPPGDVEGWRRRPSDWPVLVTE